jgi:geranylgeranylglycerol-phosphate geranylgeranyltransferase
MSKIAGYVRLMRPVNCAMMGFAVAIGAALASLKDLNASWLSLAYGFITGFTLTAASMTINDYYDRKIDAVNEPNRAIPSGLIKPKEALAFAFILSLMGFFAALLTSLSCLLVAVIAWVIFVSYTTIGKRSGLPGNFLVSACVAIPFIYGSIVVVGDVRLNVWVFVSMVFLSNTGREVTKGIVDIQGDRAQGVKTLAVRCGEKKAAITAMVFYLFAVLVSPIPLFLNLVSFWFVPLVILTDAGLVASSFMLVRDCSREGARKVKKMVLMWFIAGLLSFVAGAFG